MNYSSIIPINSQIIAERQSAKRHYGVHPYFTRRPYNVIRKYILHYSKEGDQILDPFGGSGVTAIEAFLENRIGIQNDINPLANFIAQGVVDLRHGTANDYLSALDKLKTKCEPFLDQIDSAKEAELKKFSRRVNLPPNIPLPKNSDVELYRDLFLPKQLLSLAVLKDAIDDIESKHIRNGLLLAWSSTLTKLNKTFLSSEGRLASRGGSSLFSIYRYKVAKEPVSLPAWSTFAERAENIIAAKEEIDTTIEVKVRTGGWKGKFITYTKDVEELGDKLRGTIDYIYTDPPYGAHIAYLDLSTLWNGWLGYMPSKKAKEKELIVGGDYDHSEEQYIQRLGGSIKACAEMLKPGRWMSVVFQHWNVKYFEAILQSAVESGMELKAAISQVGDPIWSMHKKKSSESVLAGEMILTFYGSGKKYRKIPAREFNVSECVGNILMSSTDGHIYGEKLFNQLVIMAWEKGAINSINISKDEFSDMLKEHGWRYSDEKHYWVRAGARESLF